MVKGHSEHLWAGSGSCNLCFDRNPSAVAEGIVHCTFAHRGRLAEDMRHGWPQNPGSGYRSHREPIETTRDVDAWLADPGLGLIEANLVEFVALLVLAMQSRKYKI